MAAAYATIALLLATGFVVAILGGGFRAIQRSDYMTYHLAGRMLLAGKGDCLYEITCQASEERSLVGEEPIVKGGPLPFNSPPTVGVLAIPFALLPLELGFDIWTILSVGVLALAAWRLAWGGRLVRFAAVALILSAWPTATAAIRGQLSIAVVAMLGLSAAALLSSLNRATGVHTSRPSGGILAGLASLKPTLVPLHWLWFAATRRWVQLARAIAAAAVLVAIALVIVGPRAVLDYPAYLLSAGSDTALGIHPEQMINWRGAADRVGGGAIGSAVLVMGTIVTLAFVGAVWTWTSRSHRAIPLAIAATFLATPLVIPHANQHEAMLAELGVLVLLAGVPPARPALVPAAIGFHSVLWLGPALSAEASGWLLFGSQLAWLVVVAAVAWRERRGHDRPPENAQPAAAPA